jgi:flagellar P-ring protein FlgI
MKVQIHSGVKLIKNSTFFKCLLSTVVSWCFVPSALAELTGTATRIKDLVEMRGVRSNPLVGYGLIVGLSGTGDSKQSLATNKAVANVLNRLGAQVDPKDVPTRNTAAVLVTAELPAFARIGDKLDLRISSIGDAKSLEGGTLVLTPLTAADSNVYAVAQGPISQGTSMAGAEGGQGNTSSAPKTVAISKSGTVEREFASTFVVNGCIELSLRNADFTTAARIAQVINETYGDYLAEPLNSGLVKVRLPSIVLGNPSHNPVSFVSAIEQITVNSDSRAYVVINERTGTIISGDNVKILPVAISHGGLQIKVNKETKRIGQIDGTATVGELVKALSALGAGPKDLVSILQSLEAAKALNAELKIM